MKKSNFMSFGKIAVVTLAAQMMLSACATKESAVTEMAATEQEIQEVAVQQAAAVTKAPTREEILARYDQKGKAASQQPAVNTAVAVVANPVVVPPVVESVVQQEIIEQPVVVAKPQVVAAKPVSKPKPRPNPTGVKGCPAEKIYGKWMSQEVRQGPKNELIPAAIGYMFREDGFFATALFNVVTGEKQGEFEGSYKTVKGKGGKCAVEFKVPSRGILNRLDYKFKSGILEVDDHNSNSRALLERI